MSLQRQAFVVRYNGESYAGWQTQPDGNTVQDKIEAALTEIAVAPIAVVCAGRTDAGVHAVAQICHADLPSNRPSMAWVRGVNGLLGAAIQIQSVHEVTDQFHARFSAVQRCYRYVLYRAKVANPLLHRRAGFVFRPLNVDLMERAAAMLRGEHDFSSFRSSQCQARSPVRQMQGIEFHENGAMLIVQFRANAFLHHMIRNIMGALIEVGTSRQSLDWFAQMFAAKDRRQGAPTFPADGLYFCGATYAPESAPDSLIIACKPSPLSEAQWWN
jgi:tRNA pseudouridine38-40 synthase